MIFLNEHETMPKNIYQTFLKLLSPFAPHMTEELWSILGNKGSITMSEWPKWDENLIKEEEIKIIIQVNGKVRGEIMMPADAVEDGIKSKALADPSVARHVVGVQKKVIY